MKKIKIKDRIDRQIQQYQLILHFIGEKNKIRGPIIPLKYYCHYYFFEMYTIQRKNIFPPETYLL